MTLAELVFLISIREVILFIFKGLVFLKKMFSKKSDQLIMGEFENILWFPPYRTLPKCISNLLDEVTSSAVDAL